jgi:hypothetical protein
MDRILSAYPGDVNMFADVAAVSLMLLLLLLLLLSVFFARLLPAADMEWDGILVLLLT